MRKLMGHLAQFASFSTQGELLCTQSLAYILLDEEARHTFSSFLRSSTNSSIPDLSIWRAEHYQADGSRPDIEGCKLDSTPVVKIEAKLDAQFGDKQLSSYWKELLENSFSSSLIILVPRYRLKEATNHTTKEFSLSGESPWKVENVSIAVITWEDAFQSLEKVTNQNLLEDLSQLCALYSALNGDDMEPLTSDEQVLSWRVRQQWWEKLVDITTRQLTLDQERLLPLSTENTPPPYFRRYVSCNVPGAETYYSIGTRDPFQNFTTPIWLRFHNKTGHFKAISHQLEHSEFATVRSGKHIWYPLEVPYDADRETMLNSLREQVEQILSVVSKVFNQTK